MAPPKTLSDEPFDLLHRTAIAASTEAQHARSLARRAMTVAVLALVVSIAQRWI